VLAGNDEPEKGGAVPVPRLDVLAMGRSSIDLYAHEIGVPMTEVKSFDAYVGGCPTNISVGTRRLGLRSALLTAVGEDEVGDFVLAFLNREGVDTSGIPRKRGSRTSAVIMSIQPPDRFPLTFYREGCADRQLTVDDVDRSPIDEAAIVVLTGTGLSHEPARQATHHAAARARRAGARVLVDIDYRPDQWTDRDAFEREMRALLARAHLAVGTEEEVRAATGEDDAGAAAARLLALGLEALVLKRGEHGSRVYEPNRTPVDVAGFKIDVLNVLGAGDAFASGFIYGLRQGWPLAKAARTGNATGAIVVTRHGCANFMPTWAEVEQFLGLQESVSGG
jgi:5-dehydro-2-deoxygluconokinase